MLDIGLRNTRNCNAVHRVKPSDTTQGFPSTPFSSKKIWGRLYQKGASKSSFAVSSLGRGTAQNVVYGNRGSDNYTSYYSNPNGRGSSLSQQEMYRGDRGLEGGYGYPKMADTSIETVDLRERGRVSRTSSNTSSSGPSPLHPQLFPGKIPPPSIMFKGWRGSSNDGSPNHVEEAISPEDSPHRDVRWRRQNGRESGGRGDVMLHRSEAFRSHLTKQGEGAKRMRRTSEDGTGRFRVRSNDAANPAGPSIPLKHSRHYRKIDLQAEKPLFTGLKDDEEASSDEEMDSFVGDNRVNPGAVTPTTSFPGKPYHMIGNYSQPPPLSVPARLEMNGRRRNHSGPPISGRRSGGFYGYSPSSRNSREKLELGGRGYFGGSAGTNFNGSEPRFINVGHYDDTGTELPPRPKFMSRPRPMAKEMASTKFYSLENLERDLQANTYCQVTVGERKDSAASDMTSHRTGISDAKLENILSKTSANSLYQDMQLPSPNSSSLYDEDKPEICLSPPLSPLSDQQRGDYMIPARASDSYMTYRSSGSMKSPVEEILAPPLSFEDIHLTSQSNVANETITEETEPQMSGGDRMERTSLGHKYSAIGTDRHSTESGYTSGQGQSPGINDRRNLSTVEEFPPLPRSETGESQDILSDLSMSSLRDSHSAHSILHSQTSLTSTESIRCLIPLVFQKSRRTHKLNSTSSSLFVVVSLVENSESLIKVSEKEYVV